MTGARISYQAISRPQTELRAKYRDLFQDGAMSIAQNCIINL